MENTYHKTVQRIKDLLDEYGVEYKTFEHEPVRTSEEAAATRPEYSISQGAKALIVRAKASGGEKKFVQVVVPGDAKFDTKKVREVVGAKDIRFATPEEVGVLTDGIVPGGVPPFGNLFNIPVYVDKSLLDNDEIIFNAGDRSYSIAIKSDDYIRVVVPEMVDVIVD